MTWGSSDYVCTFLDVWTYEGRGTDLPRPNISVPGCSMTSLEVQDSVHDFSGTTRLTPENTEE